MPVDDDEFLVMDVTKQLWIDTREYEGGKLKFLSDIYSLLTIGPQSIVYVGTKRDADSVHRTLSDAGYSCSVLHGGVAPEDQDITLQAFRDRESTVLVTTNMLARGVDMSNGMMVVNYDVPVTKDGDPDFKAYLCRIGRKTHFGRKGTAINLIGDQASLQVLAAIEQHFTSEGKEMMQQAPADPESVCDLIEI